jgi:protein gp37
MSTATKIEWTKSDDGTAGATWNPVTGCTKVSAGCDHCYAETFAERWRGIPGHHFENGFDVTLRPERLEEPLRWRRPRRVFVNSMSDLFHESVPDGFIGSVWDVMAKTPRHTYQILTKRPGRMRSLLRKWEREGWTWRRDDSLWCGPVRGPLSNVWLGVSAEDGKWWDVRWPVLAETPAAVRFVSAEPLLGPIYMGLDAGKPAPDWLIIGGESGPGARPMALEWVRDMLGQCRQPGIHTAAFVKQLGSVAGRAAGAGPKGGDWDAWPEDLKVREFPRADRAVPEP